MAPRNGNDIEAPAVRTKLWVPADRGGMPLVELAVPWVSRMTRAGFRSRLMQRVLDLARACERDTGTPAARMAARALAAASRPVPPDAPPERVATSLMNLPTTSRLLDRIDWNRSPAKAQTVAGLPINAWPQYRHETLADFLALL